LIGTVFAGLFGLFFGWIVMLLWNWLMPSLFGLSAISYWQAFGIVVLAKILFGGIGHPHKKPHDRFRHFHPHRDEYKYYERFWREEGKQAFAEYVERVRNQQEQS
jgi:hypothetical protein